MSFIEFFKKIPPHEILRKLRCHFFVWLNSYAFGSFGKRNYLFNPQIFNPKNIFLGNNLWISDKVWLATGNEGCLTIKDRVRIGRFSQIYATQSILIEDNVVMAENTYISDNTHTFDDITTPIRDQKIISLNPVVIGRGSWIGRNVCIMGCKIGKSCVIGAYSFVKKDVPDNCVVVGNPARIVKRYNPQTKEWEKTDKDGSFILHVE